MNYNYYTEYLEKLSKILNNLEEYKMKPSICDYKDFYIFKSESESEIRIDDMAEELDTYNDFLNDELNNIVSQTLCPYESELKDHAGWYHQSLL